ncbi:MAG: hypothetical protein ACI86M_002961 [Saprospiraceae bacterium]|jgi:hypothetical protein
MDKIAILTTEYLPPISSFWLMNRCEEVILETCENYQKKSTRNRSKILSVNGVDILSVPLQKGKNSGMPITEVEISYNSEWVANHLHAIKSAYGNAPYFEYYFDDIERILKYGHTRLIDLNAALVQVLVKSFDLETNIKPSADYIREYPTGIDVRKMGFNKREIKGFVPKSYNQVFEEKHVFVEDLSALDLLMCKGPEGALWL